MLPFSTDLLIKAINHLLTEEQWARNKLKHHPNKTAECHCGFIRFAIRVNADGLLEKSMDAPDVTLRIHAADLPQLVQNRERAISYVTIEGDAEFAQAIGYIAQHLRWDMAHDLSKIVGNRLAVRLADGLRNRVESIKTIHQKTSENIAEYFLEENPMLVRHAQLQKYSTSISTLRDDIERLSKRIQRIESSPLPPSA